MDSFNIRISYLIASKLPERLRTDWENSVTDNTKYPHFDSLASFLSNQCFAFETYHAESRSKSLPMKNANSDKARKKGTLTTIAKTKVVTSSAKCVLCSGDHYLSRCPQFLEKTVSHSFSFIKEKHLCTNCLWPFHSAAECNSSNFQKCNKTHNTRLHHEITPDKPEVKSFSSSPASSNPQTSLNVTANRAAIVLLPTAVVNVLVRSKVIKARVLLDYCSQVNLDSESFVKMHFIASCASSTTVSSATPGNFSSDSSMSLHLESRLNDFKIDLHADIIGRVPYEISLETTRTLEKFDLGIKVAECSTTLPSVDIINWRSARK